ncbi:MAG: hypothetical protein KBA14_07765, partial [Saprospiraceae bacterium]|nr:hypothetical protein [Saprospiraceae bacterium]
GVAHIFNPHFQGYNPPLSNYQSICYDSVAHLGVPHCLFSPQIITPDDIHHLNNDAPGRN